MRGLRALAADFGGTLARPGPRPDGTMVAAALSPLCGTVIPRGFAAVFDEVHREVRHADRADGRHTPFAEVIRRATLRSGGEVPDPVAGTEAVFTSVPDGEVYKDAATTLRFLHESGLVCVLACDTQRPESVRRRTLREAGIEDCFEALVLSSFVGVRKPHQAFYAAVQEAAGCPARQLVFVGDTPAKDVLGPLSYGMNAVLIASNGRPGGMDEAVGVIAHFTELPGYLEAARAR